jgi:hypothetical protein
MNPSISIQKITLNTSYIHRNFGSAHFKRNIGFSPKHDLKGLQGEVGDVMCKNPPPPQDFVPDTPLIGSRYEF